MAWTNETINELETMWVNGASSANIAARLNEMSGNSFTRNAIVGKARRLGLPPHVWGNKPRSEKAKVTRRAPRSAPVTRPRPPRSAPVTRPRPPRPVAVPTPAPQVGIDGGVSLIDLKAIGQCRFPFGDARSGNLLFCGHPVREDSSYCAGHHQLCYQPANRAEQERRKKEREERKTYYTPTRRIYG